MISDVSELVNELLSDNDQEHEVLKGDDKIPVVKRGRGRPPGSKKTSPSPNVLPKIPETEDVSPPMPVWTMDVTPQKSQTTDTSPEELLDLEGEIQVKRQPGRKEDMDYHPQNQTDDEVETPVKRKPGRPRKSQTVDKSDDVDDSPQNETDDVENRGREPERPQKSQTVEKPDDVDDSPQKQTADVEAPVKRRGRPPKQKSHQIKDGSPRTSVDGVPKKRGRKPKSHQENTSAPTAENQPEPRSFSKILKRPTTEDSDSDDTIVSNPTGASNIFQGAPADDEEKQEDGSPRRRSTRSEGTAQYYGDLIEFEEDYGIPPPEKKRRGSAIAAATVIADALAHTKRNGGVNSSSNLKSESSGRPRGRPKVEHGWADDDVSVGIRVSAYFECEPDDPEAQQIPSAADKDQLLPMKLYDGMVKKVESYHQLYHIEWEDGDEEDYDMHELLQGVLKYQNRRLNTSNAPAAFL